MAGWPDLLGNTFTQVHNSAPKSTKAMLGSLIWVVTASGFLDRRSGAHEKDIRQPSQETEQRCADG